MMWVEEASLYLAMLTRPADPDSYAYLVLVDGRIGNQPLARLGNYRVDSETMAPDLETTTAQRLGNYQPRLGNYQRADRKL